MERRQFIGNLAAILGISIFNVEAHYYNFLQNNTDNKYKWKQYLYLQAITNLIIPNGEIPGAKQAKCADFMIELLENSPKSEIKGTIQYFISFVSLMAMNKFNEDFLKLDLEQQIIVLNKSLEIQKIGFKTMRDLVVNTYLSSEIGHTQAREYLPIPGKYIGNVALKKDQKRWAQ